MSFINAVVFTRALRKKGTTIAAAVAMSSRSYVPG